MIYTNQISANLVGNTKAYMNVFDRKWWRENDIFIKASDLGIENPVAQSYYQPYDLVRIGNGENSFGILRTFYVAGYEHSYTIKHLLFGSK
mgnify:CR=1 FL=1